MIIRSFWGNFVSIFTIPSKNHRKCYFFTIAREMSKTYSLTNFCLWAKLTVPKMKFSIKDCSSKCDQETADLVTFTGEIPNGKFHFLCSDHSMKSNYWIAPNWHSIYLQTIASKVFLSVKLFFSCRVLPASFRFVPFKLKQDCTSNDINLWEKGILARIKVYEMGINSYLFNLVFIFIFKTYHLLTKSWPVNM